MENNKRNTDQRHMDQDQLRNNTMNENIREVSGDPDRDINETDDQGNDTGTKSRNRQSTQGTEWNPNDTSAVRSGGTTDMDDQTSGGAGLNTGARKGLGSNLKPKTGVTGSDFDGQNRTS